MKIDIVSIKGIVGPKIVKNSYFEDERGFFTEVHRDDVLIELPNPYGLVTTAQLNHSKSSKGVFRGLHFQWNEPMGKLVRVLFGSMIDVFMDIRYGSPNFGKAYAVKMDNRSGSLWVPPGFAHGFYTLEDNTEIEYACSAFYSNEGESGIHPSAAKNILEKNDVKMEDMILSDKDRNAMTLEEYKANDISYKTFPYSMWKDYEEDE